MPVRAMLAAFITIDQASTAGHADKATMYQSFRAKGVTSITHIEKKLREWFVRMYKSKYEFKEENSSYREHCIRQHARNRSGKR